MKTYVLSLADTLLDEPPAGGQVCGSGCGSTEYAFKTAKALHSAQHAVAVRLRQLADQFDRGLYSEEVDDE